MTVTSLNAFLVLLLISVVVSGILHFGVKYYVTEGIWSFVSKVVVGWVGAWLGGPVIGYWGPVYMDVAVVPAILGSAALVIVAVDVVRTLAKRA